MYSERDMIEIDRRIRGNWLALAPVVAVLLTGYVYALAAGVEWLAMVLGPLIFVAVCYGAAAFLLPNGRYRRFLKDMQNGLTREVSGTVLEISEQEEIQDGARVLPVRVLLDKGADDGKPVPGASVASRRLNLEEDTSDERIVYLNASKRDRMPGPGAHVTLKCFGRHIKSVG